MKLKKILSLLTAVLLCGALCLSASAEEWQGSDFTFTVPEKIKYTFTPATPEGDPSWVLAGEEDVSATLKDYREAGVTADFRTEDGFSIKLRSTESSLLKSIFNLRDLTEEERADFLENKLAQSQSDDITVEKSYLDVDGQPFYRVRIDGEIEGNKVHELLCGTVINGRNLCFDLYASGNTEDAPDSLVEEMARSLKFTQILEKPEQEPLNMFLLLGVLVLLLVVIVTPFIYIPLRNRRDKKQKAQMAERLSEFRQAHPGDALTGQPLFVNETDCTKETIRAFSLYHAYGKGIGSLIAGGLLCAVVLVLAFAFDMTWWIKVLAAGVTVYYLYRTINMPNAIEKVQRKVFQRGVSDTARYTFYEDGFRVGGIQSASAYAYFQITDLRRHGHYLYLYYGPDNAYPVDRFGFSLGDADEFQKFLTEKLRNNSN